MSSEFCYIIEMEDGTEYKCTAPINDVNKPNSCKSRFTQKKVNKKLKLSTDIKPLVDKRNIE